MTEANNQQNQLMQMLFGGGSDGGKGLLSTYMNPMSEGGFMNQFLSMAPALQGLTRSASDAELARAKTVGEQGVNDAASMYSGLGGLYSGANLLAGNKAMQDSMGDLSGKIASENFSLLNNLYGLGINNTANAMGNGLSSLFNLYGLNANNLAGASVPMFQQNKSGFDNLLDLAGTVASFFPGSSSKKTTTDGLFSPSSGNGGYNYGSYGSGHTGPG
jgi:hypothetical protein